MIGLQSGRSNLRCVDPFSAPPPLLMSVLIPDEPPKRHSGRFIAIAFVAVAATGGVAFAVTRGDDEPTYSLAASSAATNDATSMTFALTMDVFGSEITGDVAVDITHGLTHLSMDLGTDAIGLGGELEMIVDAPNGTTYVSSAFFEGIGVPVDTDWVRMDSAATGDTVIDAGDTGDPLDVVAALGDAVKTEEIGFDEVNGLKVKHYRATFRGADVFAWNKQFAAILEQAGGEIPDEVVYDFYVDEHNMVRRIGYQVDMGTSELTGETVVLSINEPVDITVPAEEDVTDASFVL